MRKFFLSAGVIGVLVLLFIYFTTPVSINLLASLLILPLICFLFVILEKRLKKIERLIFIIIGSCVIFIIGVAFILAITLIAANFPPENAYKEELILDVGIPQNLANYEELNSLMKTFSESTANKDIKIIDGEYKLDNNSIELLKSTKDNRNAVINFLKNNSFAIPEKYYSEQYFNLVRLGENPVNSKPFENIMYHNNKLLTLFRLELLEVSSLIQSNNNDTALIKYKDLWKVANNICSIKNHNLIDCVVSVGSVNLLLNFYDKNQKVFKTEDLRDIKQIVDNMDAKISDLFYQGFAKEYRLNVDYDYFYIKFKWPFYDKYKTAKQHHDNFYKLALSSKSPEISVVEEAVSFNPDNLSIKDYLFNPVGSFYLRMSSPSFLGMNSHVFKTNNRLNKFAQIL